MLKTGRYFITEHSSTFNVHEVQIVLESKNEKQQIEELEIGNSCLTGPNTLCTYAISETDRALRELSNGGLGLKIGQFLIGIFFRKPSAFCTKMAISRLIMVRFSTTVGKP